jgi:hypothetical protein
VSEYLLGVWCDRPKPLDYEIILKQESDPEDLEQMTFDKPIVRRIRIEAARLVPRQPLAYDDFHTHIKPRYNTRKLSALPFHLLNANLIRGKQTITRNI